MTDDDISLTVSFSRRIFMPTNLGEISRPAHKPRNCVVCGRFMRKTDAVITAQDGTIVFGPRMTLWVCNSNGHYTYSYDDPTETVVCSWCGQESVNVLVSDDNERIIVCVSCLDDNLRSEENAAL